MRINFITPSIHREIFSGGIFCILKYADGLVQRGHQVNVISGLNSVKPEWIKCDADFILKEYPAVDISSKAAFKHSILNKIEIASFEYRSEQMKSAITNDYIRRVIPDADFTIATAWNTVEPVYKYGTGKKVYFMQHFEPLFFDEELYEKFICEMTYSLPICKIANSQWLFDKIYEHNRLHNVQSTIHLCTNAIDLSVFNNKNFRSQAESKVVNVISYGGRNVRWKGFVEMAEAMALVRKRLPDFNIEWLVYGEAILPPVNGISNYTSLGFLNPNELCDAYNLADILLSASWYESFPLFPIEAMACGLAVVTTQSGTEDYAFHGETAHIVEPQNVDSIAKGLLKLITNYSYRRQLACNGEKKSQEFTWSSSIDTMESLLKNILEI